MGGEDQLKGLIRQGFALQGTADKAQGLARGTLAKSLATIKRMIETMPNEGLLRDKAWRDMEQFVRFEMEAYAKELGKAIVDQDSQAAPAMRDAAVREFENGGAELPEAVRIRNQPVANSVALALHSKVNDVTVRKLFNLDDKEKASPVAKALFKTIDTRVRGGIIRGDTTQDIADLMATDVMASGIQGVKLTAPVAKQIQNQAKAIARTATQDMARQVKEQVYNENKAALEGMVWLWSTALDSRTCETCAPLDGKRWDENDSSRPDWPLHPNCRCQSMLIDPEDPFWNSGEVTAQQIRPYEQGPYKGDGAYKTPITIDGKKYWRKTVTVTGQGGPPRYSDVLAKWAQEKDGSMTSLNQALGPERARWFKTQMGYMNADPQQVLQAMLTQAPAGEQTWIPLPKLLAKDLKPKVKKKPAPKPKAATVKTPSKTSLSPLQQEGKNVLAKVAPELNSYVSIERKAQVVLRARTQAMINAKTPEAKEIARKAYLRAANIENRAAAKVSKAMEKVRKEMLKTELPKENQKAIIDGLRFEGWGTKKKLVNDTKKQIQEFLQMFNGQGFTATGSAPWVQRLEPDLMGRGFNRLNGQVAVRIGSKENLFHELMHTVEAQRPAMGKEARDWILSKAYALDDSRLASSLKGKEMSIRNGKPVFKLSDITGTDYRDDEVAWKDDFINGYMGKDYGQDVTEVWTVAVEHFTDARTMGTLFRRHPDLFQMIVGLSKRS